MGSALRKGAWRAAACLVVGAALNCAVAWSLALWMPYTRCSPKLGGSGIFGAPVPVNDAIAWIRPLWPYPVPAPGEAFVPNWGMGSGVEFEEVVLPQGPPPPRGKYVVCMASLHASGWPFKCFRGETVTIGNHERRAGAMLPPWRQQPDPNFLNPIYRMVPLRPVPLPFAVNTAAYFAAAGLVAAKPWRFGRRTRVGYCPACNYPRAGLPPEAPCPECGAPLSGQQPKAKSQEP